MLPLLLRRCTGSSDDIAGDCFVPQLKRAHDEMVVFGRAVSMARPDCCALTLFLFKSGELDVESGTRICTVRNLIRTAKCKSECLNQRVFALNTMNSKREEIEGPNLWTIVAIAHCEGFLTWSDWCWTSRFPDWVIPNADICQLI
jgi:hypothetical protein